MGGIALRGDRSDRFDLLMSHLVDSTSGDHSGDCPDCGTPIAESLHRIAEYLGSLPYESDLIVVDAQDRSVSSPFPIWTKINSENRVL